MFKKYSHLGTRFSDIMGNITLFFFKTLQALETGIDYFFKVLLKVGTEFCQSQAVLKPNNSRAFRNNTKNKL